MSDHQPGTAVAGAAPGRLVRRAGRALLGLAALTGLAGLAVAVYALAVDVRGADGTVPEADRPVAMVPGRAVALLDAVPLTDGARFAENRRPDLEIDTLVFERTPYAVAEATVTVERAERIDLLLAGDAAGRAPWSVDNLLLIEAYVDGDLHARAYAGQSEPLWAPTGRVGRLGPAGFDFEGGAISVSRLVPPGRPTVLRVTALDNGIDAGVSDLYLVAAE